MQAVTLKMKLLRPNKGKLEKMTHMLETYRRACSWFLEQAVALGTTSRAYLNRQTYWQACELFDLNRATLQCAMLKALSAYRSYLSCKRRGKEASPPKFKKTVPVMVRQDHYSLHQLPSGTWIIKFPVTSGRSQIAVPLAASAYHARRLQDLAGGSCRQGSMEIWRDKSGEWYVAIPLVYETCSYEPGGVIGVDFGIVKLAVLSNNVFFDGRQVRWRKERWAERRAALQRAGRLSRVKREAGRERRWMRYINHCISKRIVEIAKAEGAAIALENLLGLRERAKGSKKFNRMMSGWNFRELASFIEYKAALAGVPVIYVDPKETSTTCPRCGNVSRYNRKTWGWFKCIRCGYQSDADRVAALNVAAKALDALGARPREKGECDTPQGQGDPGKNRATLANLRCGAAIPRWDAPNSLGEDVTCSGQWLVEEPRHPLVWFKEEYGLTWAEVSSALDIYIPRIFYLLRGTLKELPAHAVKTLKELGYPGDPQKDYQAFRKWKHKQLLELLREEKKRREEFEKGRSS